MGGTECRESRHVGGLTIYIMIVAMTRGPSCCLYKEKPEPRKCQALLFLSSIPLLLP